MQWNGYGSIPIATFFVGWTSIYQLFCGFTRYQGFDPSPNILSPRTSISSFSSYIPMPCFFFHPLASSQWSPEAWESWLIYGESSPFMAARFQVSDILSFTQILYDYNMHIYIYIHTVHTCIIQPQYPLGFPYLLIFIYIYPIRCTYAHHPHDPVSSSLRRRSNGFVNGWRWRLNAGDFSNDGRMMKFFDWDMPH